MKASILKCGKRGTGVACLCLRIPFPLSVSDVQKLLRCSATDGARRRLPINFPQGPEGSLVIGITVLALGKESLTS